MSNTISRRIYDFLKDYPPFNLIEKKELLAITDQIVVQYKKPGDIIFKKGDPPSAYFYVVKEGAVQLIDENENGSILVEQCDEADIFGIRPLLAAEAYALTAAVEEETLLYAIPTACFNQIIKNEPKVAFHMAISFAADANPMRTGRAARSLTTFNSNTHEEGTLIEIQSVKQSKKPVTCTVQESIRSAAAIMTQKAVGSIIIVNDQYWPIGIVTDKDLRAYVATGEVALDKSVEKIMSSPVVTIKPELSIADVQIKMIRHKVHHLCLTEDGTDKSPVVGVISEHDLLVLRGNNPAVLIREVFRTGSTDGLKEIRLRADVLLEKYLQQEVSIAYISTILSEINDAIIVRCIELSLEEMEREGNGPAPVDFCWLALGSEGRQEQLLKTDQDSALVFGYNEKGSLENDRQFFLDLARMVTAKLNYIGFDYCPADMMASNPAWCLRLDEWKRQFSKWILEPTAKAVLHSNIFFDYRPVYGNYKLSKELTDHIFIELDKQTLFLTHMAKYAVENPPPLTFFRNFVIEKSGEHKNEFDIKARAMMPLTDAARLLILGARVENVNNTFRRFEKLATLEPKNSELFEAAADAYEILIRYRTLQGLKNNDSGRFFDPADLTKMQRLNLRNSFTPIAKLQSLIETRFQIAFIR